MSHILAKRRYAFGWNKSDGARLIRFSYPLMITGLFLFIGSQGDRVVVARWLGAKPLGLYSAVLLLIYFPSALIINYLSALYIPLVSAERDHSARRAVVIGHLGGQVVLLAIVMCCGFALVAPLAVTLLYGHRYTQTALLVGLVGILQCTRALITWPTAINLALARSRTVLASNIARLLAFPGAYAGVRLLGGLEGMVAGLAVGEFAAVTIALALMNRGADRALLSGFERLALFAMTCSVIIGWDLVAAQRALVMGAVMLIPTAVLGLWIARQEAAVIAEAIHYARRGTPQLFARLGLAR
jgi:O-antigen/teichoic acid export membrane protein